jgi:hypothetical protein
MWLFYKEILFRALLATPVLVSSNWLAAGVSVSVLVLTFIVKVRSQQGYRYAKTWREKLTSTRDHWKQNLRDGVLITLGAWTLLFVVSLIQTNYDDRKVLREETERLRDINAQASKERQECEKRASDKASSGPRIVKTSGSGRLDRDLNEQQSDHLYRQLKEFAENAAKKEFATISIVQAYPEDRESRRLANRLTRIFADAHWKIPSQRMPKLQGRTQNEIPIGIWILTHNDFMRLFVWGRLQEVGLDSDERPQSDLPSEFNGLILLIGYKDVPF